MHAPGDYHIRFLFNHSHHLLRKSTPTFIHKSHLHQCVVFNLLKKGCLPVYPWVYFIDSSLRYIAATHCYPSGSPCLMVLFSSSTSPASSSTESLLLSMFTRSPVNIWQTDRTLLTVSANYNLFTLVVCSRPTEPFRHSVIRWKVFSKTKSKET